MADLSAGALNAPSIGRREPTSALLEQLKRDVPQSRVSFGWLLEYWDARSPEVPILFLALVGVLPGVSVVAGVLLAILAAAMISSGRSRALPAFIAARRLPSARVVRTIERSLPWFRWSERFARARDVALARALRPFAGLIILALSITLLVPLPLSNIFPSLAIAFVAFASIEADAWLLTASMATAFLSLSVTFAALWATVGVAARMWS